MRRFGTAAREGLCCSNTSSFGDRIDRAVTKELAGSARFVHALRGVGPTFGSRCSSQRFDEADVPFAATWRAVGEAAEELGLTRPSYYLVRALARAERLRRRARTEVRQAAVGTLLALDSPLAIDVRIAAEKLKEARGAGEACVAATQASFGPRSAAVATARAP